MVNQVEGQRGRFLWMKGDSRKKAVEKFRKKIETGYYSSEKIATDITERIVPAFESIVDRYA